MKRRYSALAALLIAGLLIPLTVRPSVATIQDDATPVAETVCGGPDGDGLILYLDVENAEDEQDGTVQSAFVVFAPDGTELYRVPVERVPTYYPLYVGCMVVVNDGGDQPMLFNPTTGEMRVLTVPEGFGDNLYPLNTWMRSQGGQRWAVLNDGVVGHALLVDTVTGEVTDLVAVVDALRGENDEIVVPLSVVLTPDESSLLFATDRDTWVMSTADPMEARLIADAVPGRVTLSGDGEHLAYLTGPNDDRYRIVTDRLDGSGQELVTEADRATTVSWVPGSGGHDLLVLNLLGGPGTVRMFVDGEERAINLDVSGTLNAHPLYSPSGRRVLFRIDDNGTCWVWLDLDTGQSRRLTELDGYPFPYTGLRSGLRWLTFYPSDQPSVEPGSVMRGLDLETGEVADLLTFEVEETYFGIPNFNDFGVSSDGRYVIVIDLGENYPGFWLLDVAQGTATEYDGRLAQSFSPDGSRLIVAGPSDPDDKRVWETQIMSVDGQDLVTLAESIGRGGLWMPA